MKEPNFHPSTSVELNDIHKFVFERLNEIKNMQELIKFHTVNKFLIMAHSPNHLRILGNIVANHKDLKIAEILKSYNEELEEAFNSTPTTKTHYNTLQHIIGHFSADFTISEKGYFEKLLQSFKGKIIELSEVLKILKESTAKYDKTYLVKQTYFLLFTEKEMCQNIFWD